MIIITQTFIYNGLLFVVPTLLCQLWLNTGLTLLLVFSFSDGIGQE